MRAGRKALAVVAVATAVLLTAAGCGGGGSKTATKSGGAPATALETKDAAAVLAAAADKTTAAQSAKFALAVGIDVRGVPDAPSGPITVKADGAFDYVARRGSFTVDLSGAKDLGGKGSPFAAGKLEMLVDGDTAYVRIPEGVANAGKWAKFTGSGGGAPGSLDFGQLRNFVDPKLSTEFLKGLAGGQATVVGTEKVRGASTTHYKVSIDATKASGGDKQDLLGGLATFGLGQLPADVWIDKDGRVRKMEVALDLGVFIKALVESFSKIGGGAGPASTLPPDLTFKMTITAETYDFGTKVDVSPPPADQVVDAASVPGLGGTTTP